MKHTLYKLSIALFAGALFLAGCAGPLDSKPEPREARGNLGRVAIQVGSPARTLQPVLTGFTRYEAAFAGPAGASHDAETLSTSTATVDLVPGAWTITVTAFTGTGEAAKKAAQGSAAVIVTANATVPAAITLTPYTGADAETGTFGYSVTYPAGTESGTLVVTNTDGTTVTDGTVNLLEGANPTTGTLTLPAGQYKMQLRLTAKDGMIAGRTEALHIYPGLNTAADYAFTGEDFTAFAEAADVTVSGTATMDDPGTAVGNAETTITLYNETFSGILADDDLSDWIANLPAGLSAKPKAGVADGVTAITLVITGTPTEGSDSALAVTIPAEFLNGGKDLTVQDNPDAKFEIGLPAASAAVTATSNLGGQEGGDFNGSITIRLTNDIFTALAADTDLATWFAAALPAGLSAKTNAAVTAGDKTLTIAITGTPTTVGATALEITIPAAVLGRETALPAADTDNKATITVSVNELPGVYIIGQPKTEIQFAEDYSDFFIVGQGKGYVFKYTKEGVAVGEQYVVTYEEETKNDILWDTMVFSGNDVHLAGRKTVEDLKYASSGVLIYQKNNGPAIEIDIPKTLNGNNTPFIVVDGDSVHLVVVSNQSDINYWKIANGAPSDRKVIATGTSLFLYGGVVLSGDNLYVGGSAGGKAVYWKYPKDAASAEVVPLSDQTSAITGGIAKSGNFIYLAGRDQVDGGVRPFYWKLNTETNHVDKISVDTTGTITHIVVSGETVYLAGTQGSPSVGGYWKISNDTAPTWCPIPGATSIARLALDGTDLYAVRSSAYWKINAETGEILGSVTTLSSDTGFSSIHGITVR